LPLYQDSAFPVEKAQIDGHPRKIRYVFSTTFLSGVGRTDSPFEPADLKEKVVVE
jgi:hypothetical protein